MADFIRRKLGGCSDRPELRISTSTSRRSSGTEEGESRHAHGSGSGHHQMSTCTDASASASSLRTSTAFAGADVDTAPATAGDTLSRCSSTDSRDSHFSNLTTKSSILAAEWQNICIVSSSDRLDQPLSPSILTSPECVRDRTTMDSVVSTTMQRVTQLHSFLSERASATGSHDRKGGYVGKAGSIRRVSSDGEDSVGQESTRSDDSLQREESQLSCAVEAMKKEMERLDRVLSMQISPDSIEECLSLTLSNDIDVDVDVDVDVKESVIMRDRVHPDGILNYRLEDEVSCCDDGRGSIASSCDKSFLGIATQKQEHHCTFPSNQNNHKLHGHVPMARTPNRKLKSSPYQNGASPSGVAEFNDDQPPSSSSSSSFGDDDVVPDFRLTSKSLLNKFDSAASVSSEQSPQPLPTSGWVESLAELAFGTDEYQVKTTILCQLASPQALPLSGWVEFLAELAFGTHEYQVKKPMSKEHVLHSRTVEGGLFVTASVSVALVLLRTSNLVAATEQQLYAAMVTIPLVARIIPHSIDETKLALSVLLGGMMLERVMC